MFLLPTKFAKNSNIWARIFFIFLKHVLKQTWNRFNTKFQPQWKYRKSSYQVRQVIGLCCHLAALILGVKTVSKTLELRRISNKLSLKESGASYNQEKVSREKNSQNIWDKL